MYPLITSLLWDCSWWRGEGRLWVASPGIQPLSHARLAGGQPLPTPPSLFLTSAFFLQGLHSSLEALPELLGGEWGKGGLVVAAEEGMSSMVDAIRNAKKIAESALMPIVNKVVSDVKVKAKIAQSAFEAVVMGLMDLVEEMGATMGAPGGGTGGQDGAAKDGSEVTSSSLPAGPSQPSTEDTSAVLGEVEKAVVEVEENEKRTDEGNKDAKKEEMVDPTTSI